MPGITEGALYILVPRRMVPRDIWLHSHGQFHNKGFPELMRTWDINSITIYRILVHVLNIRKEGEKEGRVLQFWGIYYSTIM